MDKIINIISIKSFLILITIFILGILFIPSRITPKNYFYLSKEGRINLIQELEKKCDSDKAVILSINYKEYLKDTKTGLCWNRYYQECLKRKELNDSLILPLKCAKY